MDKNSRKALARAKKARNFPINTCPASRHAEMIAEALVRKRPYPMLTEDAEHCGGSILSAVASLYEVRTALDRAYAMIAANAKRLPKNEIVKKAVGYTKAVHD